MPWREASPMDQRTQFIADHLRDALFDHRAVRAVRDLPEDRVQMDRSLPAPRASRPGGALAPTKALAA